MLSFSISAKLHPLLADLHPGQLTNEVSANAAECLMEQLRDHFLARGGRSFWQQAADSVQVTPAQAGTCHVIVAQRGVRLQWTGKPAVILPGRTASTSTGKPTRLLALPTEANPTRKNPSAYKELFFQRVKGKPRLRALLFPGEPVPAKRAYKGKPAGRMVIRKAGDVPLFTLVTETHHVPHPDVMPTQQAMQQTVLNAAEEVLRNHHLLNDNSNHQ